MPQIRVGTGFDIHRLVPGRALMLGGVEIAYHRGAEGHSDGDAAMHAVIDALLGAAAIGDIGRLFPDSDPAYKGISSVLLLRAAADRLRELNWRIKNVDLTIIVEAPKLAPHFPAMQMTIAECLGLDAADVSVKAKTNEGLGEIGRGEAVACHAVALIEATPARRRKPRLR